MRHKISQVEVVIDRRSFCLSAHHIQSFRSDEGSAELIALYCLTMFTFEDHLGQIDKLSAFCVLINVSAAPYFRE